MTRRKNPDAPLPLSLAERALAFFEANPNEALTRRDVAEKFGVHFKHVPLALGPLVREGALAQGGVGSKQYPITYSAGPGLVEGATGATLAPAPMAQARAPVIVAGKLSERERHVMDFARAFLRDNDQLPPCTAIADAFGFASANAASEIMLTLERKGHLARNELGHHMFARHSVGMWVLA